MTSQGSIPLSRRGTFSTSMSMPTPAARRHLRGRGGDPRRPEVLQGDEQVFLQQLQAALDEHLLGERVADLHVGPLGLGLLGELVGGEGGPVDAVAAGLGAEQDDEVPLARRAGAHEVLDPDEPDAHRVDERVPRVGRRELDLAADRRHPDGVAVAPDAAHDLAEEVAVPLLFQRPEPQRVQERHGPRAHGQDVADDPTDARRGPLVGLDGRGVVVALHLERERPPVPDLDDARVLARALARPAAPRSGTASGAAASSCSRSARSTSR